jgi:hypothetical protein
MQREAAEEMKTAVEHKEEYERALKDIVLKRHQKKIQISELRLPDVLDVLNDQENHELRDKVTESLNKLGYPTAVRTVEELDDAYRQAFSLAGRARALFSPLWDPKNRTAVLALSALAFIGVPLFTWGISELFEKWRLASIGAYVVEFGTLLIAGATKAHKHMAEASKYLDELEKRRDQILQVLEKKRQLVSKEETRLNNELEALRSEEDAARSRFDDADATIREIQKKIDDIDAGRSLSRFILERAEGEDYRKQLGIISTIRKDFERLTQLLKDGHEGFEKVGRIILYIDDLDRCSSAKVVEVLQAVHLLLAMPLFVVVVGVDLRWLLHSLDQEYSAFRTSAKGGEDHGLSRPEWTTSPQSYLEKIFQIPFSIGQMSSVGYGRLVNSLLPATIAAVESNGVAKAVGQVAQNTSQGSADSKPAASDHPSNMGRDLRTSGAKVNGNKPVVATRNLNPDSLRIQSWETEFAQHMFEFVMTPRSAKRFTNTYRLLKAPLAGNDLKKFEGSKTEPGEFQAAMLLLAVVTGMSSKALDLFPAILDKTNLKANWRDLFRRHLQLNSRQESVLKAIQLSGDLAPFIEWVPAVARFTFEVNKSLAAAPAIAPVRANIQSAR